MGMTRTWYGHSQLFWWLALVSIAMVLICVLAREARGIRPGARGVMTAVACAMTPASEGDASECPHIMD